MSLAAAPSRRLLLIAVLLAWLGLGGAAAAEDLAPPEAPEAWLVTYGPGEVYWQRFGHNAIWLREPGGLNHAFNFGFFDFEQERFLLRFVQGRMLYFAAAVPAEREFALYRAEGRSIRAQRLDLSPEAYGRLRSHLVRHVQPENREYLYDYFLDNCSTRLRDALDLALEGALSAATTTQPATQNFRDHTRRSTANDRDYYLGLMTGLGLPVDRPIHRWEEMFLPAVLAATAGDLELGVGDGAWPLVAEDRILARGRVATPPQRPERTWPAFAVIGLLLAGLAALVARLRPAPLAGAFVAVWLTVSGFLGLGLMAVWGLTDHSAAAPNFNLLLLNPLWLLGLFRSLGRMVAVALVLGVSMALTAAFWPSGQYLADTVALFLPLNLSAAWILWRRPLRRRVPGGAG